MKYIFFFIFFSTSQVFFSQDTLYTYYDEDWNETSKENQHFYRKSFDIDGIRNVIDYYSNGQVQMTGTYKSKREKKEVGEFMYYDSLNKISSKYTYHNGKEISEWDYRYRDSILYSIEYFEKGKFKWFQAYNPDGTKSDDPRERMPALPDCINIIDPEEQYDCTVKGILQHLKENTKYPNIARDNNISGTVFIGFVINKKGFIEDIKIEKSVSKECDKEALRVLKLLPIFQPGIQYGEPVKVQYQLPVRFVIRNNKGGK